jgi:hypothetical protein
MEQFTAIYVGGPNDGETEQMTVAPGDVLGPGQIRLHGFDVWPVESGPLGPSGRYEPGDAGTDAGTIQFVWHGYTQQQRIERLNDPDLPFRVTQLTGMPRLINKWFFGTPISAWIVRREMRRQERLNQPSESKPEVDQPDADEGVGPQRE